MHGKGPEFIPMRSGELGEIHLRDYEVTTGEKLRFSRYGNPKKNISKRVNDCLDIGHIISCPIYGTPDFFTWMENPVNIQTANIYTGIIEKYSLSEPLFITQVSKSGKVIIMIQLQKNDSGKYHIHSIQCEFSKLGISSIMNFIGKSEEFGIGENCPKFFELCDFFETLHTDEGLIGGVDGLILDNE